MRRPLLPLAALCAAAACASIAAAQSTPPATPAPPVVPPIAYKTVAEALKALEARDGESTVATHSDDGWVIINEPGAAAQWSFTPKTNAAYPAVVRRIILRSRDGVSVETASICEASKAACADLLKQFESLNERIIESARSRTPRRLPNPQ
jgi:hypothetical protein